MAQKKILETLQAIRRGEFSYEDLIEKAAQKLERIEQLYVERN